MFRTDRDALAGKVDELQSDNERLRAQNEAMRQDLLARQAADPSYAQRKNLYRGGPITEGERAALLPHSLRAYPVWATVLLHVFTLGIASFVRFNAMHDRLPKAQHDDPSALKAILLHVVPYFNFYWVFFNGLRLADRLNLQLQLRGEEVRVPRGLVIAAGVFSVLPYLNVLTAPIVWLFVAISMQRAVNRVVAADAEAAETEGRHTATAAPFAARFGPVPATPGTGAFAEHLATEEAAAAEEQGTGGPRAMARGPYESR